MCGHTRDLVIYSKFHGNPFRGFGAPGGQNLAFSITLAIRFYNRDSRAVGTLDIKQLNCDVARARAVE